MAFLSILSALLAIGFATEYAGLYAHELNVALAVLFLLIGAVLDPSTRRGDEPTDRRRLAGGVALCALGLLLIPVSPALRLFAAALWFWGLDAVSGSRGHSRGASAALALGCVIAGAFQFCYHTSLLSWYAIQAVSPLFGPSFNGLTLLVFALGACSAGILVASNRRLLPCAISLVAIPSLYLSYLLLFAAVGDVISSVENKAAEPSWIGESLRQVFPLHVPLLLPLLLAIPLGFYLGSLDRRPILATALGRPISILALGLMIVVAVWSFTNVPGARRPGELNVVFYEKGFHNWMVPTHERYGSRSGGMFGNLPLMMQRMGWRSGLAPDINAQVLADADILVIMNQKDPFSAEAVLEIDRFLERGGSLLVLGDHTFAKSASPRNLPGAAQNDARFLLNEPIGNTNIEFRFDSAYYFIGGWLHSLQYWPHQMTAHLGDATNESGCVVGASLDIRYPAVPLIIGRHGYSDRGRWDQPERGFMDDGEFDPGEEKLGDLVLVAAQNVGRGRVVVVGDTSGFVNMIQSQTWRFTSRVFHWLGSTGQATIPAWRECLGLVLLAVVVLLVWAKSSRLAGYLPAACIVFLAAGGLSRVLLASMNRPEPFRGRVATVDLSHVGRHSIEGWRDNGIAGIYLNLMRKGYFAIGSLDFDERQITESDLFFSIAPTKPYTAGEIDFLDGYLRSGGTIVLATGWEEQAGSKDLLHRFGLSIPPRPQGRASVLVPGTDVTPQFWTSWPVLGGETMVMMRDDPIISRKSIGKGQLIVIGDAGLLLNRNLETEDGPIMPNIRFFDWLLGAIEKRETP